MSAPGKGWDFGGLCEARNLTRKEGIKTVIMLSIQSIISDARFLYGKVYLLSSKLLIGKYVL